MVTLATNIYHRCTNQTLQEDTAATALCADKVLMVAFAVLWIIGMATGTDALRYTALALTLLTSLQLCCAIYCCTANGVQYT